MLRLPFPLQALALVFSLTFHIEAQVYWTKLNPALAPGVRDSSLAFDERRGRSVLAGGAGFSDTWEWDGQTWRKMAAAQFPPARGGESTVWDKARSVVVLFGGTTATTLLQDTWTWDGTAWTLHNPPTKPPARAYHSLAYDSQVGKVILFGGSTGTAASPVYLNDVWEWDGTTWTQLSPSGNSPLPRRAFALTYYPPNGALVLHGGNNGSALADTWELTRTGVTATWTQRSSILTPGCRYGSKLVYDSAVGRCVLFGGYCTSYLGDTWEWNGSQWEQRAPDPFPTSRYHPAMTYDSLRKRVVLFGGDGLGQTFNDTWEAIRPTAASHVSYGTGCSGNGAGIPKLATAFDTLPWLQSTFVLELSNLPVTPTFPYLILGASRDSWNGLLLPFDLSPIGMPGCTLRTSFDTKVDGTSVAGIARFQIAIPLSLNLVGLPLFSQGLIYVPNANLLQFLVSNAGESRIGAR